MAISDEGLSWNKFKHMGRIGRPRILLPGEHTLIVNASSTDEHGVEVDAIEVSFLCEGECPEIPNQQPVEENEKLNDVAVKECIAWIATGVSIAGFCISMIINIYSICKWCRKKQNRMQVDEKAATGFLGLANCLKCCNNKQPSVSSGHDVGQPMLKDYTA